MIDGYCLSSMLYCFKQFDRLNCDYLAGKRQKHQNVPPSKFSAIRYLHLLLYVVSKHCQCVMNVVSVVYHLCCVFLQGKWTALHSAAMHGSNNVISTLIRNGAAVNVTDNLSY